MLGESCLRHPNIDQINEMFKNGHTAVEVANYLKQVQKQKSLQISHVSLSYYRKNFLGMNRNEINVVRKEAEELGKTRDVTALTTFAAAKDFIDAKGQQTQEVMKAVDEFRNFKDEATRAIELIKTSTVDADGNPVFVPRNYEILEKFLGRLESTNNSFIKAYKEMNDLNQKATSNISITVGQVQKQTEVFKKIIKRILMELDASLVGKFFDIYKEEMNGYYKETGQDVQINISNSEGESNINIITQLPTPEEVTINTDLQNENTTEHIVDVEETTENN